MSCGNKEEKKSRKYSHEKSHGNKDAGEKSHGNVSEMKSNVSIMHSDFHSYNINYFKTEESPCDFI